MRTERDAHSRPHDEHARRLAEPVGMRFHSARPGIDADKHQVVTGGEQGSKVIALIHDHLSGCGFLHALHGHKQFRALLEDVPGIEVSNDTQSPRVTINGTPYAIGEIRTPSPRDKKQPT